MEDVHQKEGCSYTRVPSSADVGDMFNSLHLMTFPHDGLRQLCIDSRLDVQSPNVHTPCEKRPLRSKSHNHTHEALHGA